MPLEIEILSCAPPAARTTPLLFVHGAWHGAWCWERFLPYFAGRGYACHALSLRGHGGSGGHAGIRWHAAADYLTDIAAAVAALPAPPVIIGHSMGGYLAQLYLERHRLPAAVLLAPLPVMGIAGFMARYAARHPLPLLAGCLTLNTRRFVGTPALASDCFFSADLPAEALERHAARLQPESLRIALDSIALRLPRPRRGTPMLVLAAAHDRVFTSGESAATALAWGADLDVVPDLAHDGMLDTRWEAAAARVAAWLSGRGI